MAEGKHQPCSCEGDPRELGLSILTERCTKAAQRACGPEATAADVQLRAQAIYAFLMGYLRHPSERWH